MFSVEQRVFMCHGRSVGEYFVKYKEQWKNVESQAQNWTKVRRELCFSDMITGLH